MKRIFIVSVALITGLIVWSSFIPSARAVKWKSLFNGKNLKGWNVHGTEKWYVSDAELICESGPEKKYGYLSTIDSFKDFELKVEFMQEADGNSGIFFRASLDGTRITGWQRWRLPTNLQEVFMNRRAEAG